MSLYQMPNKARKNDMYHFAAPFYKAKAENVEDAQIIEEEKYK